VTTLTSPTGVDGERCSLVQWISDTAGYSALRAEALVVMLRPFDCTVRAARGVTGLRSVHIYGPNPFVDYLRDHLDGWLAALDAAANTAARRYGAWLRAQPAPDHMPAERRNLTRTYRRQYLPAWAAAWAARLDELVRDRDTDPADTPAIGHTSAHPAARHDVAHLDPQPLREAAAVIRADSLHRRCVQAAPATATPPAGSVRPDGPGRIAPGQRATCLPGSLPVQDGGRGGGVIVSIGPKTSLVDVYGGQRRRIRNELLHPEAGPWVAADRDARGLRTAHACGRGWLPGWSWLGWTIAGHLEYIRGERRLTTPPPAPQRLVIVACGARKAACLEAPAGEMYVGSYHRAARRAADALTTSGTRVMILSARYGLLDLHDRILRYEMRLGQRYSITAQGLREQAEQLGLADAGEVIVLAPSAYAALAAHAWPHAQLPLAGNCGIGEQMARLTALATGRTTVADLIDPQPEDVVPDVTLTAPSGDEHAVSIHGGLVHLAHTPPGRTGVLAALCPADQPGRQWRLTHAPITCTRCATIAARRGALDRWCAMVDRSALAADTGTVHRDQREAAPAGRDTACRTRSPFGRPARRGGRHQKRSMAPRGPGGTVRRNDRDGWRLVPAGPPGAAPPMPVNAPARDGRSRRSHPRYPRPPIGRAPPRPGSGRKTRPGAECRSATNHSKDTVPPTPHNLLTSGNASTRSRFANGLRRPSRCTTRSSPTGRTLAEPLPPARPGQPEAASTTRPTQAAPDWCERTARGLDRTLEVRPMTDLTTRPVEAAQPGPPPAPAPVNGAAVADTRTLRHVVRAEQERLSADAQVERRARAAQLDLELREQQRAAARRDREATAAEKQARIQQRLARRTARQARLRASAPQWADRALFVLPIMFPMAVAWVGQIRFAMTVMSWPLPAAIVFAAGFELSTAYVARLDWLSRAAGDSGLLFRGATWGFAAGAATMNYWHAAGPGFAPTGEAVSYGLMSITGVVLWELLSTYRHRTALRAEGKLPAARPRFGLARWIWFPKVTRLAWLLTLRDGYTTTDLAWRAALAAVDRYGSPKNARKAVRAGRTVPHPAVLENNERENNAAETADQRDTGSEQPRDVQASCPGRDTAAGNPQRDDLVRDGQRHIPSRHKDRQPNERDARPSARESARRSAASANPGGGSASEHEPPGLVIDTLSARMLAFAQERLAQGTKVTGADLDRRFGTSDYGRKIMRRLTTETHAEGGG